MKIGHKEKEILSEVTNGDLLQGFLVSGLSTKHMFKSAPNNSSARERAAYKQLLQRRLLKLEQKNLVRFTGSGETKKIWFTKQGAKVLEREELVKTIQNKQEAWDGQWRMVTFDIPQEHNRYRKELRDLLLECGFVQVQQSVYVFPYHCQELIDYLAGNKVLHKYCHCFIGAYVGDDTKLRKKFSIVK